MAKWYEVEKTEKGIKEFMECNWEFHDFRAVKIQYVPGMDMVEIFLQYDTEYLREMITDMDASCLFMKK